MPGQHVPGGLHYRLDLEQGKKWAKKLKGVNGEMSDESESERKKELNKRITILDEVVRGGGSSGGGEDGEDGEDESDDTTSNRKRAEERANRKPSGGLKYKKLTPEEKEMERAELMDRVLTGLPAPPPELVGLDRKIDPEKWKQVLNTLWEKRQREIHLAEASIHNTATAMMNATRDLVDNTTTVDEKLQILTEMERTVRQIDNAQDFKTVGGFAATALLMNDPSLDVQRMAAFVMATASRNHDVVQAAALELGVVDKLVERLSTILEPTYTPDGKDFTLRTETTKKIVLALAAVVVGSSDGVRHLQDIGGSRVMSSLLVKNKMFTTNVQLLAKHQRGVCGLRNKMFTLQTDLLESPFEWTMSSEERSAYLASITLSSAQCSDDPSREISLRLLNVLWSSSSSGGSQSGGGGDGDNALKEHNASAADVVRQWMEEWKRNIEEDSEDEYSVELMALSNMVLLHWK